MKSQTTKYVKLSVKIIISLLLIWILVEKIDFEKSFHLFKKINVQYLLPAILFFGISKFLSEERLLAYLKRIPVSLNRSQNIRLYLLGMFYNLFLPGGIGGDGYKIYFLKKKSHEVPLKRILVAILLDRFSGLLIMLLIMIGFLFLFTWNIPHKTTFQIVGIGAILVLFCALHVFLFSSSSKLILKSTLFSFGVQFAQLLSMYFILISFPDSGFYKELLFVFMISTITVMVPITIGGSGLREITFLYLAPFFKYDQTLSVSAALLFFLISAVFSLMGFYYAWKPKSITT
jgi:uncharacterized membrane protein YbhN (UPF0104 family)